MRWLFVIGMGTALSGCAVGPAITGLATAGVAGSVGAATGSATIGIAAGVASSIAVDQGVKWGERRIADGIQEAIATAAGPLAIGQSAPWAAKHRLPLVGDQSGTVEVARGFGDAIPCKDVVFKYDGDKSGRIFSATICRSDKGVWVWALAEPSVYQWNYLQ